MGCIKQETDLNRTYIIQVAEDMVFLGFHLHHNVTITKLQMRKASKEIKEKEGICLLYPF